MVLKERVEREKFEKIGKVKEYSLPRVVLEIEREKVPDKIKEVLSRFRIADLSVSEPDIADIVRNFFLESNESF